MSTTPSFGFGYFAYFCNAVALPLCPIVEDSIEPECYSRNIEVAGLLIFEPATLVIHVVALVMTGIMIYHIRNKYTAVVSGLMPPSLRPAYDFVVAGQIAMTMATIWCLLLNGFVGFQWAEDGTPMSLWSIRISSLLIFGIIYFISIATFRNMFGLSSSSPIALFIVYFTFGAAFLLIYVLLQVVLVINTLEDRWPLGDILFAFAFFVIGQILAFLSSKQICELAKHYIDGLFFSTVCTLLAVMMVYKYWDSITKEDLEFSVGGKTADWNIKDPVLGDDAMNQFAGGRQGNQPQGEEYPLQPMDRH
ncbi:Chitin synthase, class 7 [Nowakowskiella sp. JEL0407]|nr:Chitin synthase, class 7 [Nowakowskiella sp. JEL0407]